ncbi:hypothetical protein BDY21DRAFT_145046 [Lineolata rhizophorae]|uniref:Uncharacterized protein n=1 Tax=Lineolata rhizophorae TaxID=578093 RepID=A0A6A6NMW5_9PEZI|nr:hypothetical protein BDY21DRAFT_145046 [Lineolata rhizophorae]
MPTRQNFHYQFWRSAAHRPWSPSLYRRLRKCQEMRTTQRASSNVLTDNSQSVLSKLLAEEPQQMLSNLLADDRFVDELKSALSEKSPAIPAKALENGIRKVFRKPLSMEAASPLSDGPHLKTLTTTTKEHACIPHLDLYRQWTQNWLSFYVVSGITLHRIDIETAYNYTLALEFRCWFDRVRWRFLVLAHYFLSYLMELNSLPEKMQPAIKE